MKEKLKSKKVVYTIIGIISVLLVAIAVTYAYWLVTKTQEGENIVSSACLDIELVGTDDITLLDQDPIKDETAKSLKPYTFTITNKCESVVDYHINLEAIDVNGMEEISAYGLKASLNNSNPKYLYQYVEADKTVDGAYEAFILGNGTLAAKSDDTTDDEVTYELRIWIADDASIDEMNKGFRSKITVFVGQGITSDELDTRNNEEYILAQTYGLRVGDKVEYNEGSGYTTSVDSNFEMVDLEWRVLGLNDAGQLELISTQPTENTVDETKCKLGITGADGWYNAEETFNTLCTDLYANGVDSAGNKVAESARSLNMDDLIELGRGLTAEEKKVLEPNYGNRVQYQYSTTNSVMQSRKSTDGGTSWTAWTDIVATGLAKDLYIIPGGETINASNYQDENGNQKIVDSEYTCYSVEIANLISSARKTRDGILLSDFILKGTNAENNAAGEAGWNQWLPTQCKVAYAKYTSYSVFLLSKQGLIKPRGLFDSYGYEDTPYYRVRPVVTLKAGIELSDTDGDGILNVN